FCSASYLAKICAYAVIHGYSQSSGGNYTGRRRKSARKRHRNAAQVWRRIHEILGQRHWEKSLVPRSCAKCRGGRAGSPRSPWHDAREIIEVEPDVAEVFLGGTETSPAGAVLLPGGAPNERDPGIRTILFTDVVNSTTLTQSLGDEAALAILGAHDAIVRDALSALGGREIKHTGDGIMASFVSTTGAVRCAIQIQRELDKHAQANPEHPLKI